MGMDDDDFSAAPPAVGGLGNFKGVMLCNRPADDSAGGGADVTLPFRPMAAATYGEQLGLTPCKNFEPSVKKRGPSAALRRHVKWLKELQGQMKEERGQVEAEDLDADEREKKMKDIFHKHRDGVRDMIQVRDANEAEEDKVLNQKKTVARHAKKAEALAKKNGDKPAASKPMWAMTENEKDQFEEGEGDDLIHFAEGLDYEKFISDMEFREGIGALKDRAGKLQKEQDAFKDALLADFNQQAEGEDGEGSTSAGGSPRQGIDGQSLFGDQRSEYSVCSRKSKGADRYDADGKERWDSSTQCDERREENANRDAAADVLEMNPQMRAIHSKKSVEKQIQRAREQAVEDGVDLVEMMRRDGPAPVPVITASVDTQNRLHKPTDPSSLPYLYRSPAI